MTLKDDFISVWGAPAHFMAGGRVARDYAVALYWRKLAIFQRILNQRNEEEADEKIAQIFKSQVRQTPNDSDTTAGLARLTEDVLFIIYDFLDLAESMVLILSSEDMFKILCKRHIARMRRELSGGIDMIRYLTQLARFSPEPFCFECLQFHGERACAIQERYTARLWDSRSAVITFRDVQYVMRCLHEKSLARGMTVQTFVKYCLPQPPMDWVRTQHSYEAVTSSDPDPHLLIHSWSVINRKRLREMRGPHVAQTSYLVDGPVMGCQHMRGPAERDERRWIDLWAAQIGFIPAIGRCPDVVLARCTYCPTEYVLQQDSDDILLSVYMDLGNGKSPLDGEWAALFNDCDIARAPPGVAGRPDPDTVQQLDYVDQLRCIRQRFAIAKKREDDGSWAHT